MMRTEMMHKIRNNLVDVPTDTILLPSSLQLRGNSKKIQPLPCRVDTYVYSLFPETRNKIMECFTPAPNKFSH